MPRTVVSKERRPEIWRKFREDNRTIRSLAEEYGMSTSGIHNIIASDPNYEKDVGPRRSQARRIQAIKETTGRDIEEWKNRVAQAMDQRNRADQALIDAIWYGKRLGLTYVELSAATGLSIVWLRKIVTSREEDEQEA